MMSPLPGESDSGMTLPANRQNFLTLPPPSPAALSPPSSKPDIPASQPENRANADPVMTFVGDMMSIMTKFAASYQSGHAQAPSQGNQQQPVLPHPASVPEPARVQEPAHVPETSRPCPSKKPRLYSLYPNQAASVTNPSSSQPSGTNLVPIQPSTQWLGETQEDLEQQLQQIGRHSEDISLEMDEDRVTSPFPVSNGSERSEPLFTAPRQAWISHQITTQLNDLSDELYARVTNTEIKMKEATSKIIQQEARISELIKSNDELNKEVKSLKLQIPAIRKNIVQQPATGQRIIPQQVDTTHTSQREAIAPVTSQTVTGAEEPSLPQPARPSQWAESWAATSQNEPITQKRKDSDQKTAKQIKIEDIYNKGNRTLGFKPILKRRVQQFQSETSIEHLTEKEKFEAAKRMAIKDFLKNELMMDDNSIDVLPIEKTFFPRYGEAKILYVQFKDPQSRASITSRSNYLQHNEDNPENTPKLVKYIPTELYNRFKALENYTYKLRNNPSNPLSTNIRYGKDDFELRVRPAKTNPEYDDESKPDPWQFIPPTPLPDLPYVNLNKEREPAVKPPGRAPTPPPSPLPVPEELLDINDTEDDLTTSSLTNKQTSPSNDQTEGPMKRKLSTPSTKDDSIFKKPLPKKHTTFPSALDTERQLLSSSSSDQMEIQFEQAQTQQAQTCQ